MAYPYVVTSQKPTGVSHAVVGSFAGPDARNLIVAKTTRLELYAVEDESLTPIFEFPVYGRISSLELFRPEVRLTGCKGLLWVHHVVGLISRVFPHGACLQGQDTDMLCFLTDKMQLSVIAFDPASEELVAVAICDAQVRRGFAQIEQMTTGQLSRQHDLLHTCILMLLNGLLPCFPSIGVLCRTASVALWRTAQCSSWIPASRSWLCTCTRGF